MLRVLAEILIRHCFLVCLLFVDTESTPRDNEVAGGREERRYGATKKLQVLVWALRGNVRVLQNECQACESNHVDLDGAAMIAAAAALVREIGREVGGARVTESGGAPRFLH